MGRLVPKAVDLWRWVRPFVEALVALWALGEILWTLFTWLRSAPCP